LSEQHEKLREERSAAEVAISVESAPGEADTGQPAAGDAQQDAAAVDAAMILTGYVDRRYQEELDRRIAKLESLLGDAGGNRDGSD